MREKYLKRLTYAMVSVALVLCTASNHVTAQPLLSSWLKAGDPQLKQVRQLNATQYENDSRECIPDTKFITIPRDIVSGRAEKSRQVCATPTAFGYHESQIGEIMLTGSSVSGKIQTYEGGDLLIHPIPNKDSVMYFNSREPLYGSYRYIINDFSKKINVIQQPNGTIIHKLRMANPGTGIKDSADKLINFSGSHFSDDAKWMIGNAHMRGMFRINIETGENLIYGGGYNHAIGMSPNFVSAISRNGRYAIDTENRYDIFRIYDFNTCVKNTDPLKPASCQYRDLTSFINSQIPDFQRVLKARFTSDYTIRLEVQLKNNTFTYYTLTANGEEESQLDYLAIGDSFASGEGAETYRQGTDERNVNTCHLSRVSYPYLPPLRAKLNSAESVACSGAKLKDIFNNNYHEGTAQAKGKNDPSHDEEIHNLYLPGYRPQSEFVKKTKPKKVTVSITGNDIGFGKMILECIQPGTCYTDSQARLDIAHTINQQFNNLVTTYEKLKEETQANGVIYAIGYPSIIASGGNCAINVFLNEQEIKFSNQILQHLNSVIEAAAKKAGVTYVNVADALKGSRLCEIESEKSAVNGATLGDDKTFSYVILNEYLLEGYFTNSGSYHPNARGHQLLAEFIRSATNEFTTENPEKQLVTAPSLDNLITFLPSDYKNFMPRTIISEDSMAPNLLKTNTPTQLVLSGLQPFSEVHLRIGATNLGKLTADANGNITEDYTIPNTLLGSVQTLHAVGKNRTGEDIDKQKIVYITNSPGVARPDEVFAGFATSSKTPNVREDLPSLNEASTPRVGPTSQMSSGLANIKHAAVLGAASYFPQHSPMPWGLSTSNNPLNTLLDYPKKVLGTTYQSPARSLIGSPIVLAILTLIALLARIIYRKRLQ